MSYDYYDLEQSQKESQTFLRLTKMYGENNPYKDEYLSYLQCPYQFNVEGLGICRVDLDSYLFHLLKQYALYTKSERVQFLNHPYINSVTKNGGTYSFKSEFGEVKFSFWIRGLLDILSMSIKNLDNVSFIKSLTRYKEEYDRKNDGKCHNRTFLLSDSDSIVTTAFVNSELKGQKYLHSFIEKDDDIIETTANIILSKEDYYRLLRPEVLTRVTKSELIRFYFDNKDEYPLLGEIPIVQFLAEYSEIKKDPSKVKIKSFEEWKKYW